MSSPGDSISAPERWPIISSILTGQTPLPFRNLSIGSMQRDVPTEFDIFALYYPLRSPVYELASTVGPVPSRVLGLRQQIIDAQISPDSLESNRRNIAVVRKTLGATALSEIGDGREFLDAWGLPILMMAFGKRVSDAADVKLLFVPPHTEPEPLLEEFQERICELIDSERIT